MRNGSDAPVEGAAREGCRICQAGWPPFAGRALLRRPEREGRHQRRALLSRDVPGKRELMEPPGHPHGGALFALSTFLEAQRPDAKIVVWAHNSHLGDAKATEMGRRGELNLGELVREQAGSEAVLVGFTAHSGTVTAASNWDAPAERKQVRRAGAQLRVSLSRGRGSAFCLDLGGGISKSLYPERAERERSG